MVIGKLETTPVDLGKVSDKVENNGVKKTEFNEFVERLNVIDTSGLIKKN